MILAGREAPTTLIFWTGIVAGETTYAFARDATLIGNVVPPHPF